MAESKNHKVMRDWAGGLTVHVDEKCLFFRNPQVCENVR